jgi:hypothetical protein
MAQQIANRRPVARTSKRAATFAKSVIREMTPVAQSHGAINISPGTPRL